MHTTVRRIDRRARSGLAPVRVLLCWVLTGLMVLSQAVGAWHSVAHADGLERLDRPEQFGQPGVVAAVARPVARHSATWLDALFAHHLKGHGRADCIGFDHSVHAHGLPMALAGLALPALPDAWSPPGRPTAVLLARRRPFDARAPPRST